MTKYQPLLRPSTSRYYPKLKPKQPPPAPCDGCIYACQSPPIHHSCLRTKLWVFFFFCNDLKVTMHTWLLIIKTSFLNDSLMLIFTFSSKASIFRKKTCLSHLSDWLRVMWLPSDLLSPSLLYSCQSYCMFTQIFSNTYCYILGDLQWFWGDLLIVGWPMAMIFSETVAKWPETGQADAWQCHLFLLPSPLCAGAENTPINKFTYTQIHKYTNTKFNETPSLPSLPGFRC